MCRFQKLTQGCDISSNNTAIYAGEKATHLFACENESFGNRPLIFERERAARPFGQMHTKLKPVSIKHRTMEVGRRINDPKPERTETSRNPGMSTMVAQQSVERRIHPAKSTGVKDDTYGIAIAKADVYGMVGLHS